MSPSASAAAAAKTEGRHPTVGSAVVASRWSAIADRLRTGVIGDGGAMRSVLFGVPRWSDRWVSRPRLWSLLSGSEEPLLLIGPTGSGKSTLLVDWARHAPEAADRIVLWTDAATGPTAGGTWAMLADALLDVDAARPGGLLTARGGDLLRLVERAESPGPALGRALAQVAHPTTLIVEHAEGLSPTVAAGLTDVVSRADNVRLVLTLDSVAALTRDREALAVLTVQSVVGPQEPFELSADETRELLTRRRIAAAESYVGPLRALTLGDPAVTAAAADRIARSAVPPHPRELARALRPLLTPTPEAADPAWELCADLSSAVRPTADLAREVGGDDAIDLLDTAEERGWGIWDPTNSPPRFRFTAYASQALRSYARRRPPEQVRSTARAIASWAADHGEVADELCAALDAEDHERALAVVRERTDQLMLAPPVTLAAVFSRLTTQQVARAPGLLALASLAYALDRERPHALACLHAGLAAEAAGTDAPAPADVAAHAGLLVARAEGDRERAAEAGAALTRALVDDERPGRTDPHPALTAERWIELALLHRPSAPSLAYASLDRAARVAPADHPQRLRAQALTAGHRAADGDLRSARDALETLRSSQLPSAWSDRAPGLCMRVLMGWIALEQRDADTARLHLETAGRTADPTEYWTLVAEPLALARLIAAGRSRRVDAPAALVPAPLVAERGVSPAWAQVRARVLALHDLAHTLPDLAVTHLARIDQPDVATTLLRAYAHLHAQEPVAVRDQLDLALDLGLRTPRDLAQHRVVTAVLGLRGRQRVEDADALAEVATLLTAHGLSLPIALLPPMEQQMIRMAVRSVGRTARPDATEAAPARPAGLRLSERELDILRQLAAGRKLSQIAAANVVSINTVKTQARALYRKLGVGSRQEAVAVGRELGLLDPPPISDRGR